MSCLACRTFSGTPERSDLCSKCFAARSSFSSVGALSRVGGAASAHDTDDAALAAALAESATLHSSTITSPLIDRHYRIERAHPDVVLSGDPINLSTAAFPPRTDGALLQVGVLNQFHRDWQPMITQHRAPAAICGFTALAHSVMLSLMIEETGELPSTPSAARDALSSFADISPRVDAAMARIAEMRMAWMDAHRSDFTSARENAYLREWVANFELSDYLRLLDPSISRHIIFVRFNQAPERSKAVKPYANEEHGRIAEEEPFLDESAPLGPANILVETFARGTERARRLLHPAEALALKSENSWRVAVIDVNGHFVAAFALREDLVVLNTTEADYVSSQGRYTCAVAHDVLVTPAV